MAKKKPNKKTPAKSPSPSTSVPASHSETEGRGDSFYEGSHGPAPEGGFEANPPSSPPSEGYPIVRLTGRKGSGRKATEYGGNPLGWAETFRRKMRAKAAAAEIAGERQMASSGLPGRLAGAFKKYAVAGQLDMAGRHPIATGVQIGTVAAPILGALSKAVRGRMDEFGDLRGTFEKRAELEGQRRAAEQATLMRAERVASLMQMNLQRLSQAAPDLYMQIAAGQRLPQGATVLGGRPRTDLLRDVAQGMAEGRFGGQNPDMQMLEAGIGPGGLVGGPPNVGGQGSMM